MVPSKSIEKSDMIHILQIIINTSEWLGLCENLKLSHIDMSGEYSKFMFSSE